MVIGLGLFTDYFREYQDYYILIGGAATDIWMEDADLDFRITKDLDVILVVEALDKEFVSHFWKFIEEGEYRMKQKSDGSPRVYRFIQPGRANFPYQIELFSRIPDILGDFEGAHLAPLPICEELSSLSVILMNDLYYSFTRKNSDIIDGLHLATIPALICLKAKAFLDIKDRLDKVDEYDKSLISQLKRDYKKHRNDVLRLTLILESSNEIRLEYTMKQDMQHFMEFAKADPPDYQQLTKTFGVSEVNPDEILYRLKTTFNL